MRPEVIAITRRKFGISISDVFFAKGLNYIPPLPTIGFLVQSQEAFPGAVPFQTLIVDLEPAPETIFSGFSKNTREKIRRAEKESLAAEICLAPEAKHIAFFADYYDRFARHKDIALSNRRKLDALCRANALALSFIKDQQGKMLVAHAYIRDAASCRVRLLYSASHFRMYDDSRMRNFIGRANRLLHWYDMLRFKNLGFRQYDFGGLAYARSDPALEAIANFKLGFGGHSLVEYTGIVPGDRLGRVLLMVRNVKNMRQR